MGLLFVSRQSLLFVFDKVNEQQESLDDTDVDPLLGVVDIEDTDAAAAADDDDGGDVDVEENDEESVLSLKSR